MRKIVIAVIVLMCLLGFSGPGYCGSACSRTECVSAGPALDNSCVQDGSMFKKLGRGVCNAITFPFEIFAQMGKVNTTDGPMAGWTWGLLKGLGMAGTRAAVGVYEIVTFPVPCPEGYRPILTDPEFFFEEQNW